MATDDFFINKLRDILRVCFLDRTFLDPPTQIIPYKHNESKSADALDSRGLAVDRGVHESRRRTCRDEARRKESVGLAR